MTALPSASATLALPTYTKIFDALAGRFGLRPRSSQLKLASIVRDTVGRGGVCCVEAPTGTGKTLGYLAGALDAQAHAGNPVPVVVATATVGLQEQILRHDIPRLAAVGAVDARRVCVAKGRGRYFCPRTARLLEDKRMQDGQFDMFAPDKHVADGGIPIALDMLSAWEKGEWDGDRDSWAGKIPECWEASCGASADTCVRRACEHYDKCPYMQSRQKLATAQVIIANHDIVLADLAQRADEQSITVLPPKTYTLIVDEAHNLPQKAVATRRACAKLSDTDWLRQMTPYGEACLGVARVASALSRSVECEPDVLTVGSAQLAVSLEDLANYVDGVCKFTAANISTWGLASPEQELLMRVGEVASLAMEVLAGLKLVAKAYAEVAEEAVGAEKAFAIKMLSQTYRYTRLAAELQAGLNAFVSTDSMVRWVYRTRSNNLQLNSQPLEGREVLTEFLWKAEIPVVLVSATLQIAGAFDRFRDKSGLPGHAVTLALPPVFDYSRGYLHLPTMQAEPGTAGYEAELQDKLVRLFEKVVAPGMLVLFTSRESMRRVAAALPAAMKACLLVQDGKAVPELVAHHKAVIDGGGRSILMGLDSMAEGLDLPGRYCGHVVITRLPFAVPGDPVESARREYLGKDWFDKAYLADMLTMLIQATGRLIRREEDHGVITVLDRRLTTKKYCTLAMSALPQFSRGTKLDGYFNLAKSRGFDLTHGLRAERLTVVKGGAIPAPATTSKVEVPAATSVKPAAPQRSEPTVVGPAVKLQTLRQLPCMTHAAVTCGVDTLRATLARLMPPAAGPFESSEPDYLVKDRPGEYTLPVGTPASTFIDRQMVEASLLGLRLRNLPVDTTVQPWIQLLCARPDLFQSADILRSHHAGLFDERTLSVAEAECQAVLHRTLGGLGYHDENELFAVLNQVEAEVLYVLSNTFQLPNPHVLQAMHSYSTALATSLRPRPMGGG